MASSLCEDDDDEALLSSIHEDSNSVSIISDIFKRIHRDGKIINTLGGDEHANIVKWYGNEKAEVLFLCAMPLCSQSRILDKEEKVIYSKVNPVFCKYNQEGNFLIASCTAGRNKKDRFLKTPNALDVALTAKYLRELCLRMPNLRLVITLDSLSAEFMHRNLDPFHMYGVTSFQHIHPLTKPSPTMFRRTVTEKIEHAHIEGKIVVRSFYVDLYNKNIATYISHALSRLYDQEQPLLRMSVSNVPTEAPESSTSTLTYEEFETKMLNDFNQTYSLRQQGETVDPTKHMASHFIPGSSAPESHFYLFKTAYDPTNNWMNLFTRLPDGSGSLIRAHDPVFTFWFRAHRAFAADPISWQPRTRPLHNDNLTHLTDMLDEKLKYMWYTHRNAYKTSTNEKVRPFTLSVEAKGRRYAYSDGYTHNYMASFIRCDVRHYDFIAVITKLLQKIVTAYTNNHPPSRKRTKRPSEPKKRVRFTDQTTEKEEEEDDDWDEVYFFDYLENKFHTFMTTTPENMFANSYGLRMSHWHVCDNIRFQRLETVDGTGVPRLSIRDITMVDENTIRFLPPSRDTVIRGSITSMDPPPTIRLAYDIECVPLNAGRFPVAYTDAVVCICVAARIHDDTKSQFNTKPRVDEVTGEKILPNYAPTDGYAYYSFVLGSAQVEREGVAHTEDKVGSEHVFGFQNERDMLKAFFVWRRAMVPAYIYTHNGRDFDERFLLTRARVLGVDVPSQGFVEGELSRVSQYKFQSRGTAEIMISVVEGQNGVVHADTNVIARSEFRNLKSRGLGFLASLFVNMTKSEMPYPAIAGHWRNSDETRRILIDYCYRDAQLCDQIINCKQLVTIITATARASRVSEDRIHDAGMQEKVYGALAMQNFGLKNRVLINSADMKEKTFNELINENFMGLDEEEEEKEDDDSAVIAQFAVPEEKKKPPGKISSFFQSTGTSSSKLAASSVPVEKKMPSDADIIRALNLAKNDTSRNPDYQGAVVMSVPFAFYWQFPVGCLDFASLYPSIMRAFNQSSCTLVFFSDMKYYGITEDMCKLLPEDHVGINPRTGKKERYCFVRKCYRVGLMTLTQDTLVNDRNEIKKLLPKYGQEFLEDGSPNPHYNKVIESNLIQISNGKKLIANSAYGASGTDGPIGNKLIASAVTAVGRHYIMIGRRATEEKYGGVCAGGDTDSIFMFFPGQEEGDVKISTPEEMAAFAPIWVAEMLKLFRKKCKLEYEKCMYPLITIAKKHYANGHHEPGKNPVIKTKGMETVRRDALPYLKETLSKIIEMIIVLRPSTMDFDTYANLIAENKKKAVDYIRDRAKALLDGKVGISDLILSKNLSSEYYTSMKQEHLTVLRLKQERGQKPPTVGERVHFVYVLHPEDSTTRKQKKGYEIADDPQWVIENDLQINYVHYLENKFVKPIVRIMCYFLKTEMIERIRKKNPKVAEITLKMLKDETEDYLFSPARKGSVYRKKQHSHFTALSGNKIVLPKANKANQSSIAFYSEKQSSILEEERQSQGIYDDDGAVLGSCVKKMDELQKEYNKCMEKCRGCLKIQAHQEILCDAYECKFYDPRIVAKKNFEKMRGRVDSVLIDIEDLA